jgi:hypothetical protein
MGQQTIKSFDKKLAIVLGFLSLAIAILIDAMVGTKTLIQTLLLLTICTAGIGGVIILAVVFLVGAAEVILLEFIVHVWNGSEQKNYPVLKEYSVNPAVLQYVLQAKKHSFSNEKIKANLLHAGWDPKIIDQALSV